MSSGIDVDGPVTTDSDRDVVIVGGGPAGCSAGVFTARHGLDTLIFDRGRSSIQRCAHLENYLGFPAGLDIETYYELIHDHAESAGCELAPQMVTSVTRSAVDGPFEVTTQEGRTVTARRVVAAARYDGDYLRELGGDAMFDSHEHDGEVHEHFDRSYAGDDGETPVQRLYVASPSGESDRQAIVAAGRGARVALRVVADARVDIGYPEELSEFYDWMRPRHDEPVSLDDRDAWMEWFRAELPADHGLSEATVDRIAERERRLMDELHISSEEVERRAAEAHLRLDEHLRSEPALSDIPDERLLDNVADESVLDHAAAIRPAEPE